MSLFPAYSFVEKPETQNESTNLPKNVNGDKSWLNNSSFISFNPIQPPVYNDESDEEMCAVNTRKHSSDEGSPTTQKHKKRKRDKKKTENVPMDFDGNEEYYVDKTSCSNYINLTCLKKPACPRYKPNYKIIGAHKFSKKFEFKRYFYRKHHQRKTDLCEDIQNFTYDEKEYDENIRKVKEILRQNPKSIEDWILYVNMQDRAPIKCSKTQLAEKKTNLIERALIHNIGDQKLYTLYIDILNSTYPSFEVSKKLEVLINKDPTNYVLWNAQILSTQGSMARCIVPDVLKLYEEGMQKIFRKNIEDEILLKLFSNCAYFIRQAGLSEQFFALIKLALELNTSEAKLTATFQPLQSDQDLLIEYEEVILKSGLPMNEIWLRIEKLRQNFNFLPNPSTSTQCSDPQRIIFNEDICYFIYPLAHKEHIFHLILIILRLLKVPIIATSTIQDNFLFNSDMFNEFDAIEDILSIYLYQNTATFSKSDPFNTTLYNLVKDLVSSPSYIFTNIGSEIYFNTVCNIILLCAQCFQNDHRKNQLFILIWLRFEKTIVILRKLAKKLTADDHTNLKKKVKNLFKREQHRNVMNLYVEYALIEYEFGNLDVAENILTKTICDGDSAVPNSDFCYAYVCYAELMLRTDNPVKALKILTSYALNISLKNLESMGALTESEKQSAFHKISERLNELIQIEKNVLIMELDQHYLPDFITNLIKVKIYYQVLLGEKLQAMAYMENLLIHFNSKSQRSLFVREKIYEIYLDIMQWPCKLSYVTNTLVFETATRALQEFPKNIYILRICTSLEGQPWYKLRGLLKYSCSPVLVIFLIISARNRMMKQKTNCMDILESGGIDTSEESCKIRIRNLLHSCLGKLSPLRKNSLLWRIYIRSLCDSDVSFVTVKNVLFSALDECPWNKELYLDGGVCVPQELPQLQDLLIEKQLRIYALPEELEILRSDDNIHNIKT